MSRRRTPSLVLSSLGRHPKRTSILVLCVASIIGLQVAAALLDRASKKGLEVVLHRLGADLVVVPTGAEGSMFESLMRGEAGLFYMDAAIETEIASKPFVARTASQVYVQSLSGASCCSLARIFLIGYDPATDFTVGPWCAEQDVGRVGPDQVVIGAAIDSSPGETLKFFGHGFEVAAVLDASGTGLDATIFIPIQTVYRMAKQSDRKAEKPLLLKSNQISAVLVSLKPEIRLSTAIYGIADELEESFPEVDILLPDEMLLRVQHNISNTMSALRHTSFAIWPITAILIGFVFTLITGERQREIGLLRACGASGGFVFKMIVSEVVGVTVLGAFLGLVLSVGFLIGFSRLIATRLAVPFYWPPAQELSVLFLGFLAAALVTGVVAALIPAFRISRMEPYEAIRGG